MKQNTTIFLAVKSINVTHSLLVYFYLNNSDVPPHMTELRAGRKQFKRFSKFNAISKRTFFELHAHMLLFLYDRWQEEYAKKGPALADFNDLLSQVKNSLH